MIVLYRVSQRNVSKVIFQNETDRATFISENVVKEDKAMLVAGSGVDLERFAFVARPFAEPIRFLFIGRLIKDKGIREFTRAAKILRLSGHQVELTVLGSIDEQHSAFISQEELELMFEDTGIAHHEFSDQVEDFLCCTDCVVLPSYREGTSRVLLEAAAMGTPIITTDVPGCREAVRNQNGLLCKAQDAKSLAIKMEEFVAMSPEQKREMGSRGRRLVEESYNETDVVNTYITYLQDFEPAPGE